MVVSVYHRVLVWCLVLVTTVSFLAATGVGGAVAGSQHDVRGTWQFESVR